MKPLLGFAAVMALALAAACGGHSSSVPPAGRPASGPHTGAFRTKTAVKEYSAAVLADSPLVYYRMNETSGTTATDSSGNGYNGTYGSSVVLGSSGLIADEAAPVFPGGTATSAKVLTSSTNSALKPTGAMSVELWVNVPASLGSGTQTIFTQSFASGSFSQPVYIALTGGSSPFFTLQMNANGTSLAAYGTPALNALNHVVLTWTGSALTGYVNGVSSSGGTGTGPVSNYASPYTGFTVGGPVDAHTGYTGSLSEVALYGSALSSTRVTAHYNAAIAASSTPTPLPGYAGAVLADSPVVYYRTNETSGTTAADSSGNGYNGTYGSSVTLGGTGVTLGGDTAPSFPGGTATSAKVLTSSTNSALKPTGAMSVELWVHVPASLGSGTQTIFTQSFASGSFSQPVYIALTGGSSPFFTLQMNANGTSLAAYGTPTLNANNHVVLTWTGTTLTGYVNGVSSSGGTGTGPVSNYASPYTGFTAGGPVDAHTGYTGLVGEVALYNSALSSTRVTAHYNAGTSSASARTAIWSIGNPFELAAAADGQGTDRPVFSGSSATCAPETPDPQTACTGGSGTASFHLQRANTTTTPAPEWRNMMTPQTTDGNGYNSDYTLADGGIYDVQFQTVNRMPNDAQYVQSLLWQDHAQNPPAMVSDVLTGLGVENYDGNGNKFFFNYGCGSLTSSPPCQNHHEGGSGDPYPWYGTTTQGGIDTWEIQFKNSADSSGWIDMYRNGVRQVHYSGIVVGSTSYDLTSFGLYYYNWEDTTRSTLLSTDITFNYFKLSSIPGPIPPAMP